MPNEYEELLPTMDYTKPRCNSVFPGIIKDLNKVIVQEN